MQRLAGGGPDRPRAAGRQKRFGLEASFRQAHFAQACLRRTDHGAIAAGVDHGARPIVARFGRHVLHIARVGPVGGNVARHDWMPPEDAVLALQCVQQAAGVAILRRPAAPPVPVASSTRWSMPSGRVAGHTQAPCGPSSVTVSPGVSAGNS
ncbi:hypothetical protein G6F24_016572 [Rhizopus arrhizus]|nr:hypothetical protein G6F24_016572 [Rhizopus arrhizus]